jgi:hypothetical protein
MHAMAREARGGAFAIVQLAGEPFRESRLEVIVPRGRRLPRVLKAFADVLGGDLHCALIDRRQRSGVS